MMAHNYLASWATSSSDNGFPCFDSNLFSTLIRVTSSGIGT